MATTYTAANLQTINNFSDIDNEALELAVDVMISHINAQTGASLAHFRDDTVNAAGSKTVSITDAQEPAFLAGAALILRAYSEQGPNTAAGGMAITAIISDPHYKVWNRMFNQALNTLRGTSFERA